MSPITSFQRDTIGRSYHDSNPSLQVKMVSFSVPWKQLNILTEGTSCKGSPQHCPGGPTALTTYNVLILSVRGSGHHIAPQRKGEKASWRLPEIPKCQGWHQEQSKLPNPKWVTGLGERERETSVSNANLTCNPHDSKAASMQVLNQWWADVWPASLKKRASQE